MKKQILVVAFLISCIFGFSQSSVVIADTVIATQKSSVKENTITTNSKFEDFNQQKAKTQTKDFPVPITLDIDRPEPTQVILTPIEEPKFN